MHKFLKVLFAFCLTVVLCSPALGAETYGRVVAYDKDAKKMTFIEDALGWSNPKRPEFIVLPPKEVTLAEDPGDMAPKAEGVCASITRPRKSLSTIPAPLPWIRSR